MKLTWLDIYYFNNNILKLIKHSKLKLLLIKMTGYFITKNKIIILIIEYRQLSFKRGLIRDKNKPKFLYFFWVIELIFVK